LLVNSNWWTLLRNHPNQPDYLLHPKLEQIPDRFISPFQIERAAGLAINAFGMNRAILEGKIEQEYFGKDRKGILCMHQYTKMFGWTRIPEIPSDYNINPGNSVSGHIIVILRNQLFSLNMMDPMTKVSFGLETIKRQLWWIVNYVFNLKNVEPNIPILTSEHRDTWAKLRKSLVDLSPDNVKSLSIIESSLFVLALDDWCYPDSFDNYLANFAYSKYGCNRWYDKTISIIVMANGVSGLNGEHSPCDALIPSRLMDWVTIFLIISLFKMNLLLIQKIP
jgi:hypothetical protein